MSDQPADEEPFLCLGGCGKQLTSRKSRARGYGKDCWRKRHGHPGRRAHATPAAKPGPGQPELPYDDQLELELWST